MANYIFGAVCVYEALGCLTRKIKTLTSLCVGRPWLAVLLVLALAYHFWLNRKRKVVVL